jgi:hypothetical protein
MATAALIVSILALFVSGLVAYYTLFRRGTVEMTRPSLIYLGYDHDGDGIKAFAPKIFLRTLLFSTADRGLIIDALHAVLSKGDVSYSFAYWGYGARNELVRGSGLFVGKNGVEANHHFNPIKRPPNFCFGVGEWKLEIYAEIFGITNAKLLHSTTLVISEDDADTLTNVLAGLHFNWEPTEKKYISGTALRPLALNLRVQ